uniref:Uncharacterized protein n=1 Tax=viral metagenome TaxID=1070528 RepID=A0A6C0AR11_9ZZZZ
MSNYFKQNSRFEVLSEEINGNKGFKRDDRRDDRRDDKRDDRRDDKRDDKSDNHFNNKTSNLSYRERQFANSAFREQQIAKNEQKRLEEEREKNLSAESFPELIKTTKINTTNSMPSFLEKITIELEKKEESKSEKQNLIETLKPGWALFRYDNETNKTTMFEKRIIRNEQNPLSELDIIYNIFDGLANLHENRRQEYIDNWGEDEYEKMFIFPNYDYDYFDKLDEKYDEEMRKYNDAVRQQYNYDDDYYEE